MDLQPRTWWTASWRWRHPHIVFLVKWHGNKISARTTGEFLEMNIFNYILMYSHALIRELFTRRNKIPKAQINRDSIK